MTEPVYDEGARKHRLVELLRTLAARIEALRSDDELLAAGPELLKLMGDARSELFHYEVRSTYDSPEVAESRRIVDQARRQADHIDFDEGDLDLGDSEEDSSWRNP